MKSKGESVEESLVDSERMMGVKMVIQPCQLDPSALALKMVVYIFIQHGLVQP